MTAVLEEVPWMCRLRARVASASWLSSASPDVLSRAAAELGVGTVQWAVEAGDALLSALNRDANHAGASLLSARGVETELLLLLLQLKDQEAVDDLRVAEAALADARTLARSGVPATVLMERVWRLHALVQDSMLATTVATDHGGAVRRDDLPRLTRYSQRAARILLEAHESEAESWAVARRARDRVLVERILAGESIAAADEDLLGVRLEGHHLMTLVTETGGHAVDVDDPRVVTLVRTLSDHLPGWRVKALALAAETLLWWTRSLSSAETPSPPDVEVPNGLSVAMSDPQTGPSGPARAYVQARRAASVGVHPGGAQLSIHRDVLLVSTLLADPIAARELVARELAGVVGRDARSGELRETLLMFLRAGGSRKAVAQQLSLAPTTVAYRIERFETLRGRPLNASRLETWVALEIADRVPGMLGDGVRLD